MPAGIYTQSFAMHDDANMRGGGPPPYRAKPSKSRDKCCTTKKHWWSKQDKDAATVETSRDNVEASLKELTKSSPNSSTTSLCPQSNGSTVDGKQMRQGHELQLEHKKRPFHWSDCLALAGPIF